jgi:mobilome CxxCx(11)CxxC protein
MQMLDDNMKSQLMAYRMDALTAKHLHAGRLHPLRAASAIIDYMALAVPVLYFAIRFLAKGTDVAGIAEAIWEILAALLFALVLVKLSFKFEERIERHAKGLANNSTLAVSCLRLIEDAQVSSKREYDMLADKATELETEDRTVLGKVTDPVKQRAYREALKEFDTQGKAQCSVCGASAYSYHPGSCQVCGNSPAKRGQI